LILVAVRRRETPGGGGGCGSKLWCIPAGGGVNPNAGYDWWRF
jgi:hypothetical protein